MHQDETREMRALKLQSITLKSVGVGFSGWVKVRLEERKK